MNNSVIRMLCALTPALLLSACSVMVDPGYGGHAARMRKDAPASAVEGMWHRRQQVGGYDFTDTFLFRKDGTGLFKSRSVQAAKTADHAVRPYHWRFDGDGRWTMWFDDSPGTLYELHTDGTVLLRTYTSSAGFAREVIRRL